MPKPTSLPAACHPQALQPARLPKSTGKLSEGRAEDESRAGPLRAWPASSALVLHSKHAHSVGRAGREPVRTAPLLEEQHGLPRKGASSHTGFAAPP